MIDKGKRYWFYIYPYVYLTVRKGKLLAFHTRNGRNIETGSSICISLVEEVQQKDRLGVTELKEEYRMEEECVRFIESALEKEIAGVSEIIAGQPTPVIFRPVLNLQSEVDKMKNEKFNFIGQDLIRYLNQLNIYINNSCIQTCKYCKDYYKQLPFCSCGDSPLRQTELRPEIIASMLERAKRSVMKKVNLLGGDVTRYPYWEELSRVMGAYNYEYHVWVAYTNLSLAKEWAEKRRDCVLDVLVSFPLEEKVFGPCISSLEQEEDRIFHFVVENEKQYERAEEIIRQYKIAQADILPFFNGSNRSFFEDQVALSKEDILNRPIEQRVIFCNQKLNSNYFGILNIMSDGNVWANLHKGVIGNVYRNDLLEIIYHEILTRASWRDIRSEAPCAECLYQYLCPPPSNYEYVMKRYNLCSVEQGERERVNFPEGSR